MQTRQLLTEHFRCPEEFVPEFILSQALTGSFGFFRLGEQTFCYGQCSSGLPAPKVTEPLHDVTSHIRINRLNVQLPFDPAQIVDNLRNERYRENSSGTARSIVGRGKIRSLYYRLRPLLPVAMRKHLQRIYLRDWNDIPFPQWPVDRTVEVLLERLLSLSMNSRNVRRVPFIWFWPDGARSSTIVTHDVETSSGRDFCPQLMDLNDSFGVKSSFQIVPENRYDVSEAYLLNIRQRGFEVAVHDLNHDGLLFADQQEFLSRAKRINDYARQWSAEGFRSAIMYRNTNWFYALDVSYDMSIPNVAHLEPQRGGCCTVFPFFVGNIVELPLTTIQDYSLFHIVKESSTRLWQEQISLIRLKHGLISVLIHPDYIIDETRRLLYRELLAYLSELRAAGETWIALPQDVAAWWRLRKELTLVRSGSVWKIEGEGAERARIAYASLVDGNLQYEICGSDVASVSLS